MLSFYPSRPIPLIERFVTICGCRGIYLLLLRSTNLHFNMLRYHVKLVVIVCMCIYFLQIDTTTSPHTARYVDAIVDLVRTSHFLLTGQLLPNATYPCGRGLPWSSFDVSSWMMTTPLWHSDVSPSPTSQMTPSWCWWRLVWLLFPVLRCCVYLSLFPFTSPYEGSRYVFDWGWSGQYLFI